METDQYFKADHNSGSFWAKTRERKLAIMSERWAISQKEPLFYKETLSIATIYRSVLIILKRGGDGDVGADSRKANVISYTKKFGRTLH